MQYHQGGRTPKPMDQQVAELADRLKKGGGACKTDSLGLR